MCGKNKTQGDSEMSVETEVKAVEQEAVAEVAKVETEVKTVAEAVGVVATDPFRQASGILALLVVVFRRPAEDTVYD